MLIDWFTVGAQALNFVILVWLMKHFLYQPVLDAIAAREKRIADQIADTQAGQAQVTTERKALQDKNTDFDQQRDALLVKATADAKAEGERLIDEAKQTAAALASKRQQSLVAQAEQLQHVIASRAADEVFAVVRKTLKDLANADLEDRMVAVFLQHLSEQPTAAKEPLAKALKLSTAPALIRSHFDLSANQRAAIQDAINTTFSADVPLRFETGASTVCGIELSTGGQKLAWTIDTYLQDFEHKVAGLLVPAATPITA